MSWARLLQTLALTIVAVLFLGSLLAIVLTGPVVVQPPRLELDVSASPARLRRTVETLCTEFGPRDQQHSENLLRASAWIARRFQETGLVVELQEYELPQGRFRNVIALRAGTDPQAGAVVIGAHYDAFAGSPGANDNASGVAVLLELALTLPALAPRRDQYLVAFGSGEPPSFGSAGMGSYRFAEKLQAENVRVQLMLALDLVGYFSDRPGSQRFPFPGLGLIYPDSGDFIAVIGDLGSGASIKRVKLGMMSMEALPVHSFRAPASFPGVDDSDHVSFRRQGLPGVLVSDTAFMRFPHYHGPQDTPDKLDYERMALVVRALHGVLWDNLGS